MAEVTIGVDIGTTSVKALAVDAEGTVVGRARVRHGVQAPTAVRLEHDADAAWRTGVRAAHAQVSAGHRVAAVQVAAMVPSLCAVDAEGRPVTPGLLYGDGRGGRPTTADPADSGELMGFARWCAQAAPDASGLWPAQAVANHALSGRAAIDTVLAMMAAPLHDGQRWDPAVCREIGARPEQFPDVVPTGQAVGKVGDALLGSGTIDAYTEQLCAGAVHDGDVLVICGTTLITWLVTPAWIEAPGVWTIPALVGGKAMVGGPSNAGGLFLEWARRLVGDAAEVPIDPERIPVWMPYVRGERTPLHDPARRAAVHDLDLTHGPAALRQAAYEAAGFVVRHHLDLVASPARRIVATGGGTQDARWMQAMADATGLAVETVAVPEGGAYGAAFLARVVAGLEARPEDATRWARTGARYEPRPLWVDATARRYRRFRQLTAAS